MPIVPVVAEACIAIKGRYAAADNQTAIELLCNTSPPNAAGTGLISRQLHKITTSLLLFMTLSLNL
ncbi:hypothetical protein A5320_02405 [Rheinheimera sp. SA_1]|nr:hypothetical protein A5320_02405 [Rheinheimera sp. SA_1]